MQNYSCLYDNYLALYEEFSYAASICDNYSGVETIFIPPTNPGPGGGVGQGVDAFDNQPGYYETIPYTELFNPNGLTCLNGGSLSEVTTYLQQLVSLISNPDLNVQITYTNGVSPEYINASYTQIISGLEFDIALIEQQYLELYQENEFFQELLSQMQNEINDYVNQLSDAVNQNNALSLDFSTLQSLYDTLLAEFNIVNDGITQETLDIVSANYLEAIEDLETNVAVLETINGELSAVVGALGFENIDLDAALETAQEELDSANNQLSLLEEQFLALFDLYNEVVALAEQTEIDLQTDITNLENEISGLQAQIDNLQATNATLEEQVLQYEALNNSLSATISGMVDVYNELTAEIAELELSNQLLADQANLLLAEADVLLAEIEQTQSLYEESVANLAAANETITQLEQELADSGLETEGLQGQIENLQATNASLQEQIEQYEAIMNTVVDEAVYLAALEELNSIIPEDGITQETLDNAVADAEAAWNEEMQITELTYNASLQALSAAYEYANSELVSTQELLESALANQEDGITQADVDAMQAYMQSLIDNITPEDGVSQADLDALQQTLEEVQAANQVDLADLQEQLNQAIADAAANEAAAYAEGAASVTPEDGIGQADVDAAYQEGFNAGANSVQQNFTQQDLDNAFADGANSVTPEDGISQADVDAAYLQGQQDGAAGVIPEDGISQADVDAAYQDGVNSVQQQITQSDLDAAYEDGVNSVTPDDGITQFDVDQAYAAGVASVQPEDGITQADVDQAFQDGAASVTPEDGIGQTQVDQAYEQGYAAGQASVTPEDGVGQAQVDQAYEQGFSEGQASVTPDDGISQADVDQAFQDGLDEGAASVSISQEAIDSAYDSGFAQGQLQTVSEVDSGGCGFITGLYGDAFNNLYDHMVDNCPECLQSYYESQGLTTPPNTGGKTIQPAGLNTLINYAKELERELGVRTEIPQILNPKSNTINGKLPVKNNRIKRY